MTVRAWLQERPWALETVVALFWLVIGVALMPVFIFYLGVAALGRYEGASLRLQYGSLADGLREGSVPSWLVFLGPYLLYLLFRALRLWWRAGQANAT